MAESPFIVVDDLTGGINDLDSPFSIDSNQCVEAKNLDFRRGQIGTKRNGLAPVSLTGSVFQYARPRIGTTNQGGFVAANTGNITVSSYANVTDSTTNTMHLLVVTIAVNNAVTTITSVTLGATPLTVRQSIANGLGGRVAIYTLVAPSLAGGTLTVNLGGVADCSIVAQRWTEVDPATPYNGGTTSGAATHSEIGVGILIGRVQVAVTGIPSANILTNATGGQIDSRDQTNGGAKQNTTSVLTWSSAATENNAAWTFNANIAFASAAITFVGRNDITGGTLGVTGNIAALIHTSPTNVVTDDQLWAFDTWGRMDFLVSSGVWSGEITRVNTQVGVFKAGSYDTNIVNLHGKTFMALVPGVGGTMSDRLTVYDGTLLRWAGLIAPTVPAVVSAGVGAYPATLRYYRVRWIEMVGSTIVRRSEPSPSISFTPTPGGASAQITSPGFGTVSGFGGFFEGQTHVEFEASTDNVLFYRIATQIGLTYADSALIATYSSNPLSEPIGEYMVPTAPRHVAVDQDRLLTGGSVFTALEDSRVRWTELRAADGVGNDERIPITTRHYQDLDALDGGRLTHMIAGQMGGVYVFKLQKIYKVVASGAIEVAYRVIHNTNARGCLPRAGATATNPDGQPTIYFVDPNVGVCTFGDGGIKDLMRTRLIPSRINRLQTVLNARVLVHPNEWLVWVWLALDSATIPNYCCCYNVLTGGWTDYTGRMATVVNADKYLASGVFEPFIAIGGNFGTAANSSYIYQADIGASDGTFGDVSYYRAFITTKPYQKGTLLGKFNVLGATLHALKSAATIAGVALIRNLGLDRKDVTADLAGVGTETYIVRPMDDATTEPSQFVQFELGDPVSYAGSQLAQTWTLDELVAKTAQADEDPM